MRGPSDIDRRAIIAIAGPAIVSNITTPVLGLVDTAIVGHIGSAVYLAAIALGGAMFNMLYWLFDFLRMGSSGLTAQAYGASDRIEADALLWRGLLVAGAVSLLMIALSHPIASGVLAFMDADNDAQPLARLYFTTGIWGAPAALGTYVVAGWLLGMQDSRTPMWMAIVTNVVNIAVSLVLVLLLGLKLRGVAMGTVVAQWVGLAFGLMVVWRRYRPQRPQWQRVLMLERVRHFFSVNTDIMLRTVCLVAVTLWFTHAGARQGSDYLAANALLMQFFMLFSFFVDGLAYAAEAITGRLKGAGEHRELVAVVRHLLSVGMVMALVCSALYFVGGHWVIDLLTDDTAVRTLARIYHPWVVLVPLAGYAAFVFDGVFVGTTLTRGMLAALAVASSVFFALWAIFGPSLGNDALWLAFVIYLATRGAVQWLIWRHTTKKNKDL